jgi:hypothetical protein
MRVSKGESVFLWKHPNIVCGRVSNQRFHSGIFATAKLHATVGLHAVLFLVIGFHKGGEILGADTSGLTELFTYGSSKYMAPSKNARRVVT